MVQANHPTPELVNEIVEHLLVKYEELPKADRKFIVSASIEAVALIAASETAAHHGKNIHEARKRNVDCHKLFAAELERDLISCSAAE